MSEFNVPQRNIVSGADYLKAAKDAEQKQRLAKSVDFATVAPVEIVVVDPKKKA